MKMHWVIDGTDIRQVKTQRVSSDTSWCYVFEDPKKPEPYYAHLAVELFDDRWTAIKNLLPKLEARQEAGEELGQEIEYWKAEFAKGYYG